MSTIADFSQVPARLVGDLRLLNCTPTCVLIEIDSETIKLEPCGVLTNYRTVANGTGRIGSIHAVVTNGKAIPFRLLPKNKETIVFCS